MKRLNDKVSDPLQVIAPASVSPGAPTSNKINTTGYGRARFVFSFGANGGTTANLLTNGGIWKAATSGGTFTSVATAVLAAVTSGVLGANIMVIDMPTDPDKPWLQVSGMTVSSTAIVMGCNVELYNGINRPPTSTAQQQVVI